MALEITHEFQSAKGDGPDATLVQPSDWNALHKMVLETGLVGYTGAGAGPAAVVPLGVGLAFEAGALVNTVKGLPIGTVVPFAGGFAPPYWLMCYGQEVDRTIFATLFSVIGTTYGVGNGSTTFNIPDLRGRVAAGRDNMGGTNANRIKDTVDGKVMGNTVGTERHILTVNQLATHNHAGSTAVADGLHRHLNVIEGDQTNSNPTIDANESIVSQNTANLSYRLNGSTATPDVGRSGEAGSHTHALNIVDAGTNEPHLNMQPSIIMNYIIWAGAQV